MKLSREINETNRTWKGNKGSHRKPWGNGVKAQSENILMRFNTMYNRYTLIEQNSKESDIVSKSTSKYILIPLLP